MTAKKAKAPTVAAVEAFWNEPTHKARFKMNFNTTPSTVAIPGLTIPSGARAILVAEAQDGKFTTTPVNYGQSVVNLRTELLDHLTAQPYSDEMLLELRDYCDARLQARADAKACGGIAIQRAARTWEVTHIPSIYPSNS
jgi:hypothetical protein